LLNLQQLSTALNSSDANINIRVSYKRHRSLPQTVVTNRPFAWDAFPGMTVQLVVTEDRRIKKGDLAAICLDYGKVSQAMLKVHATELWNMERLLKATPSATNTILPDLYQGGVANLMGMAYYERNGRFKDVNERLQKNRVVSEFAYGLASLAAKRVSGALPNSGDVILVQPKVDMNFRETVIVGNHTIHPDSGADAEQSDLNYRALQLAELSAEEHHAIDGFFQQSNSISSVKLLQLAQQRTAAGGSNVLILNSQNFVAAGNVSYGGTLLKNHDAALWAQTTNFLTRATVSNLNVAFVTPGAITNSSNSYKGMGTLWFSPYFESAAVIGGNLNGGVGPIFGDTSFTSGNALNYSLLLDPNGDYYFGFTPPTSGNPVLAPDSFANYNAGNVANNATANNYAYSGYQTTWDLMVANYLGLNYGGSDNLNFAQGVQAANGDNGFLGWTGDGLSQNGSGVADPVHMVTGEFYINATDLTLPGPMSLVVNRNYSSLNLAENQFGFGWKLDYMPYLSLNTNATVIFAAEPDGAVIAYEKTATNANVYLPTPAKNPQLNNNTSAGIGSVANRLRNRIEKQVVGADTFYFLANPDGSKRTFKVMTFTGSINQTRPFLTRWEDSCGNAFTVEYGFDSTQPDYGQARRIQSSNGNYLGFYFDVYGHITDAYTGDGRRLHYDYDQFGDLVTVTFPDASQIDYVYEHKTQLVSGKQTPYSTHLVLQEIKPDGRVLKNEYDQNRRVTNQWATVGADLTLVRNASFIYSNNFNLTNSFTNTITGFTVVKDVFNNTNRYDYTDSLITKITDPLNQTIVQDWYEISETNKVGYYPRSLESRTDKRGLVTQFKYDSNGNLTNTVRTGDLTGDGTIQSATNTVVFDTNNLPVLATDPAGNKVQTLYHLQYPFLPEYVIRIAGTTPVSTNKMVYGNVTNAVVFGGTTYTNMAMGVLLQEIRAFGSPDAATNQFTRDGRGFITQSTRFTGTSDPSSINSFYYSDRGEIIQQTDSAGRKTTFDYDGFSRPIAHQVFDTGQNTPLSWDYSYYNPNGELTWSDGPRFDPEDYIWRDYDGAGRLITEIHWRSQGKADGTGVEAPTRDALFATTFREYDNFGNLKRTIDPRGGITTNAWDFLGRLTQRTALDFDGTTVLNSEGFAYEPGNLVRFQTNALGGVTETQYTTNGLPKFRRNADGSTSGWRYYLDGRTRREIQGNGAYWESTYDDANRKTTRIFYSAGGSPLATNISEFDRRGNLIRRTDEAGNIFTSVFDGLDRLKISAGPPVVSVHQDCGFVPDCGVYVTNVMQHTITNFYDAAGITLTAVNALGEKTITTFDALGRTTRVEIRDAANQLVRETSTVYSADHHGLVVTQGSGPTKIDTYQFTDNDGQNVLSALLSSGSRLEYTLHRYDPGGLLTEDVHLSNTGGSVVSEWAKTFTHDGAGRLIIQFDRDDALTLFYRDAMGNITNRTMPDGLQWIARYNTAGQMLEEKNAGSGGLAMRTNTYSYYLSGPFAGLLQTRTDGRGVSCVYTYDDWLRPATNAFAGGAPEQNLTTTWGYDARGLVTTINEQFASSSTGPATTIQRNFDSYGQLSSESVSIGGNMFYSAGQSWDAAGRRTVLSLGNGFGFSWRPDGLLASASINQFGGAGYNYDTAGLLTSRTVGGRVTTIESRDGAGRPQTVMTKLNTVTKLTETLTWTGDGLLNTHTLDRSGDFIDSRSYVYADLSRRLVEERLNLSASKRWTNIYTFDNGAGSGPGVLTRIAQTASQTTWSGVKDAFSRIGTETNTATRQFAYGRLNGPSSVTALLDGMPQSTTLTSVAATNSQWPYQWRTTMELTPGPHRLDVSAAHPSGQFTTNQTSWFTNNIASLTITNLSDGAGNLTQRIWRKPNGTTNLVQTLSWDARGRLYKVAERDSTQSGRDFTVTYDALGRRMRTAEVAVTNNVALTNQPLIVSHYFDPSVEFLELGVVENGKTTWKLIGPDFDGKYGSQNGTGGFEAMASGFSFTPVIADSLGNIHGVYEQAGMIWSSNRIAAYGGVPSYRPVALGSQSGSLATKYAWRNRAADSVGFVWMGGNWLDPQNGRFLAFDVKGHNEGMCVSGYDTFGGNPINWWDPNGLAVIQVWQQTQQNLIQGGGFWNNAAAYGISFGITAINAFSVGSFSKNDALADRNIAGEISDAQFYGGMSVNAAVAGASIYTGGAAGTFTAGRLIAAGARPLVGLTVSGAAAGFTSSVTDVAGTRIGYALTGNEYGATVGQDLTSIGISTGIGGGFGALTYAGLRGEGIVYNRTDANGIVDPYYGQAQSEARYPVRQGEHDAKFPNADFNFERVDSGNPGRDLDFVEQWWISANGGSRTQNPNTPLSNVNRAMNDADFWSIIDNAMNTSSALGAFGNGVYNGVTLSKH
jgi:YD repeat-containing protein